MIDTCDDNVAAWGEDGTTFVVKNPETFEKVIIPQFFKHSKFSSFVRQLNFYGFRKIKFADSIRINTALEQRTANFWRFRHENFRKGREDLLIEIKRSKSEEGVRGGKKGKGVKKEKEADKGGVKELKTELETMKSRMEKMTKEIDELTNLVQTVKLDNNQNKNQVSNETDADSVEGNRHVGQKRKKVQPFNVTSSVSSLSDLSDDMVVDPVMSSTSVQVAPVPVVNTDVSEALNMPFNPSVIFPIEPQEDIKGDSETEETFVDDLFRSLDDEDLLSLAPIEPISMSVEESAPVSPPQPESPPSSSAVAAYPTPSPTRKANAPDEEMMNKLSDALTVLPKEIQGLLVNRLINTITSSEALKEHMDVIKRESQQKEEKKIMPVAVPSNPNVALPLAAATLTALMTQFSVAMNEKKKPVVNTSKTVPVIPIHA